MSLASRLLSIFAVFILLAGCNGDADDPATEPGTPEATEPEAPDEETPQDEEPDDGDDPAGFEGHGFEDGDRFSIVLGSAPGGGFDTQARLLAPLFEAALRELTGASVTVIVENQPGAAHRIATEHVNNAEPGSSLIFSALQLLSTNQIIEEAEYDLREMVAVGSAGTSQRAVVILADLELPERTFNGLIERSQETPILLTHPGLETDVRLLAALLREGGVEYNVDDVPMGSTSDQMASLLRGETEAAQTTTAGMAPFVEDNPEDIEFLVNLGCEREPAAPDVETIIEQDVPNAEAICSAVGGDDRVFFAPPGTPDATAGVIAEALRMAITHETYVEQASEAGLTHTWRDAEAVRALTESVLDTYVQYRDQLVVD